MMDVQIVAGLIKNVFTETVTFYDDYEITEFYELIHIAWS